MRSAVVIWGSLCLIVGAQNIRGPSEVTIQYGGPLSVTCKYEDGFESYVKYWCKGESWKSCAVIIKSGDGSHHRYSIQDYPGGHKFTITGREMRPEDSDTYYCGMERAFSDDMHAVRVTVLQGKCERKMTWGQNISMYPEKEYYGQEEEVTLTCPAEYRPNYSKIQCIRINGNNIWNVTEVSCIYSPKVTPAIPIHSPSWRNIGVSFCFGVIPPMVVKLITIVVILVVKVYVKRSTSSVEERPRDREADTRMMKSPPRARTNVYHKATEDQKIASGVENDLEPVYVNMEADPSCNVYTTTS